MGLELHTYCLKDRRNPFAHLFLIVPSSCPEDEKKVLLDASVHQELEVLEHYAHLSSQVRYLLVPDAVEFESASLSLTLVQRIFRYDGPDYGSLSGTYLSYDVDEVSWIYIHIEVIDHGSFSVYDVGVSE